MPQLNRHNMSKVATCTQFLGYENPLDLLPQVFICSFQVTSIKTNNRPCPHGFHFRGNLIRHDSITQRVVKTAHRDTLIQSINIIIHPGTVSVFVMIINHLFLPDDFALYHCTWHAAGAKLLSRSKVNCTNSIINNVDKLK